MTAVRNTVILGSSRMMGNYHVRFLEEGNPVRGCPYSTETDKGPKGPVIEMIQMAMVERMAYRIR